MSSERVPAESFDAALRLVLEKTYAEFRLSGDWPAAWKIDLQLDVELGPFGGIEGVARSFEDLLVAGPVEHETSRVLLRLRALSILPEASGDVEAFLALCRFVGATFRNSDKRPVQVTRKEFCASAGVDDSLALRAFQIALCDGHFWVSGSTDGFQLGYFASKLSNVSTVDEFEAVKRAYDAGRQTRATTSPRSLGTSKNSKRYFLSHAASDYKVAAYLERLIKAGDKTASVFVASLPGHIPTGDDWLEKIRTELRGADAYFVLMSDRSVGRPWIWFETGAAWFSDRPLIPLALPGFEKSRIPQPLAAHQALSLSSQREVEQLFSDLTIALPDPEIVVKEIRALCQDADWTNPNAGPSSQVVIANDFVLSGAAEGLTREAIQLLRAAAAQDGSILRPNVLGGAYIQVGEKRFNRQGDRRDTARWNAALAELESAGFAKQTDANGEVFDLTHEGFLEADRLGPSKADDVAP